MHSQNSPDKINNEKGKHFPWRHLTTDKTTNTYPHSQLPENRTSGTFFLSTAPGQAILKGRLICSINEILFLSQGHLLHITITRGQSMHVTVRLLFFFSCRCFSWPSAEDIFKYKTDVLHAQKTVPAFARLLELLATHTTARNINILSYSADSVLRYATIHTGRSRLGRPDSNEISDEKKDAPRQQ